MHLVEVYQSMRDTLLTYPTCQKNAFGRDLSIYEGYFAYLSNLPENFDSKSNKTRKLSMNLNIKKKISGRDIIIFT